MYVFVVYLDQNIKALSDIPHGPIIKTFFFLKNGFVSLTILITRKYQSKCQTPVHSCRMIKIEQ